MEHLKSKHFLKVLRGPSPACFEGIRLPWQEALVFTSEFRNLMMFARLTSHSKDTCLEKQFSRQMQAVVADAGLRPFECCTRVARVFAENDSGVKESPGQPVQTLCWRKRLERF